MASENELTGTGRAATDDTEEASFLKLTPWIFDAYLQDPDALLSTLRQEAHRLKELPLKPLFSLLAVIHNTAPRHLSDFILSVRCQSYENWELVLVVDSSTTRNHLEIARSWAGRDARIRVRNAPFPPGSSRAKNVAIEESTGDFVIVADGNGVLHPMALGVFARHFNANPSLNFIFTNEAEIDPLSTELTNFVVKPPLDLFTLLRIAYIGRLFAVSRDMLERAALGGPVFRDEYDGIEEHDLCLRLALTEGIEAKHVPLFTYYRRASSRGPARLTDLELVDRRRRLADEFVPRVYPGSSSALNVGRERDPLAPTSIWLTDLAGSVTPKLLIVIPFRDEVETTIQCLESIERQEHRLDVLVVLVNNHSTKKRTLPKLRSWIDSPRTARYQILDHDGAFNFAKLNNHAIDHAGGDRELILLLNNDVDLSMPQTLQTMAMQLLADHSIAFLGIKLYYPGGEEIQHGGIRLGEFTCGSGYHEVKHGTSAGEFVDAERITMGVTFACAMTRRETFEKLGGLDEIYLPNGFGDVSMCLRALEAGYRNYYLGSLSAIHHESKSRGFANEDAEFSFMYERHGPAIASWRNWHLIKSYRYAWPILMLPFDYPPPPSELEPSQAEPAGPYEAPVYGKPVNRLPLRYRLADRLNEAVKDLLGPLHGPVRRGIPRLVKGIRLVRQPGGLMTLGRRVLGPMPVVGKVARKCLRQARTLRYGYRLSSGFLKVVCRQPNAARLLAIGLWKGGARGLRQSVQMLVPVTGDVHPSPQEWFDATRPSRRLLARLRRRTWPLHSPKFTVIMPVYNVREEWLRQAVESVIAQTYPHWQMICINDNSTEPHIRPTLDELAARDKRIRVIHCATNRGVSVATNLALARATGEYIAFLDHDDYLEPHALHRFAEVVMRDNPDMIYSDEAMTHPEIDRIIVPACRSSFSYDYFLSHPYFVHLIAARTEIVHRIGGLNEEMTISQDVDFVLRLLEACRDIAHVGEVLYRWRTHPGSLGHQQQDKVYSMTRGALERHFDRVGLAVEFDDKTHFNFRDLRFALTAPARVAIVIPTLDQPARLRASLASLEFTVPPELAEIVILDQSSDETGARSVVADLHIRHRVVRCERDLSISALLNRGAAAATAPSHYLFLHDDTEAIAPGWLEHMLGYAQRADVAIVGATLLYEDETIQHAGIAIGLNGTHDHVLRHANFRHPDLKRCVGNNGILLATRDVSAVTGACLLVRADAFERLGGFDDSLAVAYHDLDLCLRARALGYKVIQNAYAVLYHAELEGREFVPGSPGWHDLRRFLSRHGARVFSGDPFYSPLMSPISTQMALARPTPAPARANWRTTRITLPSACTGSRSFRVDAASPARHGTQHIRAIQSAGLHDRPRAS
jgi:GT2 family glycosyltransferase